MHTFQPPRFGTASIAEVLPSIAAALGEPGFDNHLGYPDVAHAVLLVVDGMGWQQVQQHCDELPLLGAAMREQQPVDAAFPTTTPAGLATLTLAMPPGRHGMVGATFYLPDFETVLAPLHWDDEPFPPAVQPEPTVFQRLQHTVVHRHGPSKYADTGMTRTFLAGAIAHDYESFDPDIITRRTQHLDYVYLPKLDKLGHTYGPNTPKWIAYLREIDELVGYLARRIGPEGAVFVTSDHGMVTIPDAHRIDIDVDDFMFGVDIVAGEPRMRHLYGPDADRLKDRWQDLLAGKATVLLRDEAIAAGLFGQVDPFLAERIGDVLAIANDDWLLASQRVDPRGSAMTGVHGALTLAEVQVPALVIGGVA